MGAKLSELITAPNSLLESSLSRTIIIHSHQNMAEETVLKDVVDITSSVPIFPPQPTGFEVFDVVLLRTKNNGLNTKSTVSNKWFHSTDVSLRDDSPYANYIKSCIKTELMDNRFVASSRTYKSECAFLLGLPVQGANVKGQVNSGESVRVGVTLHEKKGINWKEGLADTVKSACKDLISTNPDIKGKITKPAWSRGNSRAALGIVTAEFKGKLEKQTVSSSICAELTAGIQDIGLGVRGGRSASSEVTTNDNEKFSTVAAKFIVYAVERTDNKISILDQISIFDGNDRTDVKNLASWVNFDRNWFRKLQPKRPAVEHKVETPDSTIAQPRSGYVAPIPGSMDPPGTYGELLEQACNIVSNTSSVAHSRNVSIDGTSSSDTSMSCILTLDPLFESSQTPPRAEDVTEAITSILTLDPLFESSQTPPREEDVTEAINKRLKMTGPDGIKIEYSFSGSFNLVVTAPLVWLSDLFKLLKKSDIFVCKNWKLTSMTPAFKFDPIEVGLVPIFGPNELPGEDVPAAVLRYEGETICIVPLDGADETNYSVATIHDSDWEVETTAFSIGREEKVHKSEFSSEEEMSLLESLKMQGFAEVIDYDICKEGKVLVLRQDLKATYDVDLEQTTTEPNHHVIGKDLVVMISDDDDDDDSSQDEENIYYLYSQSNQYRIKVDDRFEPIHLPPFFVPPPPPGISSRNGSSDSGGIGSVLKCTQVN